MRSTNLSTDQLADNIRRSFLLASPGEVADGMFWYPTAHTFATGLATKHGITVAQAAGIVAALSPQVSWERNLVLAETLCELRTAKTLGASVYKALAILDGADPLDVLGGPKVRAFYACILEPNTALTVCIDRHAYDVAVGQVTGDKARGSLERVGEYGRIADAYRTVANEFGVMPHQVQAVTWVSWRNRKAVR